MSGIMSMFSNLVGGGSNNQNQAQNPPAGNQSGQSTPGNIPATAPNTGASNVNTAPNGVVPTTESTPLDQFNKLWETEDKSGEQPSPGIFGEIDPQRFMEAAGKIDFSKVITPEQLTAISAGGEDAVKAFAAALNTVAQHTYAQSAYASTKIVEQAMARAKDSFLQELPQLIKHQTVKEKLRAENPIFSNPAVQPIISALEAQLTVKYPSASAGEITTMAKQYVEALGASFAPKQTTNTDSTKPGGREDEDWSKFFSS